jgi:pimeloyl-ACP methyl ester carboxylesterase
MGTFDNSPRQNAYQAKIFTDTIPRMSSITRFGCEIARRRSLQVGALRLSCLEWGEPGRPPLGFLHGGSAHAHWWDRVAPAFGDRFHVIALDQRGHGESDWADPPAYATENFATDLLGVLDALGWRRAILVGHSMGGHNAMSFSAWHPDRVSALVIVDSRPSIPTDRLARLRTRGQRTLRPYPTQEAAAQSFRLLPRETVADPDFLRHLGRAGVVERDGQWVYRFDPSSNGSRQPVDAWTLIDRITAPTLIVRGELSPNLPPDVVARLRAGIRGTTSFAEIPGSYHHLVLDNPTAFVQALATFLASTPGASNASS